jgi:hypothetical protein
MKKEKIVKLLDRYFEGETSSSEEEILRKYFSGDKVAHELEDYKQIFGYFSSENRDFEKLKFQSGGRERYGKMFFGFRRVVPALSLAAASLLLILVLLPEERGYRLIIDGNKIYNQELALKIASENLDKIRIMSSPAGRNLSKLGKATIVENYLEQMKIEDEVLNSIDKLMKKLSNE